MHEKMLYNYILIICINIKYTKFKNETLTRTKKKNQEETNGSGIMKITAKSMIARQFEIYMHSEKVRKWYKTGPKAPMSNRYYLGSTGSN